MVQPGPTAKRLLYQGTGGRARASRLVKEVSCAVRRNTAMQHGAGLKSRKGMGPVRTHFRTNISFKTEPIKGDLAKRQHHRKRVSQILPKCPILLILDPTRCMCTDRSLLTLLLPFPNLLIPISGQIPFLQRL